MTARAPRLDPLEVRRTLRREGLRASHSRSQNFLADPDVLQGILDLADAEAGTRVLEIGPGLGILTGGLLDGGASVTAVELDARLAAYLRTRFAQPIDDGQLRLIEADALDCPRSCPARTWSSPTCPTTSPARCCIDCSAANRCPSASC
jgi:16S rRNA (adenine1518-N6/adenine1519-N6)-dimethyltransferase